MELTNAAVPGDVLRSHPLPAEGCAPVHRALQVGALSRRGADTVLRLAWSAADIDGATCPTRGHIELALGLRQVPTAGTAKTAMAPPLAAAPVVEREVR